MGFKKTKKYDVDELAGCNAVIEKTLLHDQENNTISVNLVMPREMASKTVVIIPAGLGATKENSSKVVLMPEFLKYNISTLLYDHYGHGESSGKIFDITPTKIINSLDAIMEYLKDKGFDQIVLYASSAPALACVVSTVQHSSEINLLILQSPLFDFKDLLITLKGKDGLEKWRERGYYVHQGQIGHRRIGYGYYLDSLKYNIYRDYLPKIACKTLLIAAGKDHAIKTEKIDEIGPILKDKEYYVLENADHIYSDPADRQRLNKLILDFVMRNLNWKNSL